MKVIYYGEILEAWPVNMNLYSLDRISYSPTGRDFELLLDCYYGKSVEDFWNIKKYRKKHVIIKEVEREIFLQNEDQITVNGQEGNIESKWYDDDNDTMHYYTDIEVQVIDDEVEANKEKIRVMIKEKAEKILNENFENWQSGVLKRKSEKKTLWKRIFG